MNHGAATDDPVALCQALIRCPGYALQGLR